VLHGFMPITIRVVTAAEFETWVGQKQAELGIEAPVEVAAATQN
jgi:heme/copper-type cytochrome/quinol oxidase subunit 2